MIAANKTWVCATCGQGVTRKSSGLRHIMRLHSGKAMLVRPYVYIAGIASGRLQQSDPSLYRKSSRQEFTNRPPPNSVSGLRFQESTNQVVHERTQGHKTATDIRTRLFSDINANHTNHSLPKAGSHNEIGSLISADSLGSIIIRQQMLQQIERLAHRYCQPYIAEGIVRTAKNMALLEDDKSLHNALEKLYEIANSSR
jgi:hypothetical protein